MTARQLAQDGDSIVRHYQYDDKNVVAADVPVDDEHVSVDVLDDVALVVVENGTESYQAEIDLPDGDAEVFINNGVVTIEVRL